MHIYITKYALSSGISEADVDPPKSEFPNLVVDRGSDSKKTYDAYYHKPHWHRTREAAVARAEVMREARIAALQRQLKKLKSLKFV